MADAKKSIYHALLQVQKDMGPVLKNATYPAFKSKYADLGSVIDTISETLNNNGLVYFQPLRVIDGMQYLDTNIVLAETGESIESSALLVCKDPNDPQKIGGAITYFRRYELLSLLGLAPEDDDGNSASTPGNSSTQAPGNTASQTYSNPEEPVFCEIPGCKNQVKPEFVNYGRKQHEGHDICYFHSKNGDWKASLNAGKPTYTNTDTGEVHTTPDEFRVDQEDINRAANEELPF